MIQRGSVLIPLDSPGQSCGQWSSLNIPGGLWRSLDINGGELGSVVVLKLNGAQWKSMETSLGLLGLIRAQSGTVGVIGA